MKKLSKLLTFILVALMAFGSFTACGSFESPGSTEVSKSDSAKESVEDILSGLDMDFTDELNTDIVTKIEEEQWTGETGVIIRLSDDSLLSYYNESHDGYETVNDFRKSKRADDYLVAADRRKSSVINLLRSRNLVTDIKYAYETVMDGLLVTSTFENVADIRDLPGVESVTVSQTYLPAATEPVSNVVNVYDTGIFDSSDVEYTGKNTVVAILDTGCDYTHSAFTSHTVVDPHYDSKDIERLLPDTVAYGYDSSLQARDVYYGNVTRGKIAFGYDYADKNPEVMPLEAEHGTHVAGIIGGSDSTITGVAVDAQLAIMKVFSDYKSGAETGDILAALEDSVNLQVDAINMSLGTSCGFTSAEHELETTHIYNMINEAGISLIVAASNDSSSAYGSELGNTNKTYNPDSATVGAPSTYEAALSVASINGKKDNYMVDGEGRAIFFNQSSNLSGKNHDFFAMLSDAWGGQEVFEYVAIPGTGADVNYIGLEMEGKIALVRRGDNTFEEKVNFAARNNAAAIIVYNNVFGDIFMNVGNTPKIPVISISKDDGDYLAAKKTGSLTLKKVNDAGPFMSSFSSWGPTPDLKLKPEITAHGGNILSSVPGGGYEEMSGTSMAAPNMCGIAVLIRQYVKEKFPEFTSVQVRDMVNRLCMSTATIALNQVGNPYSPRKQGAGLASLYNSVNTGAYLYVDGLTTTKLELGDDPLRTGVYEMSFNLCNISDASLSYDLGDLSMTESVSTSDDEFVAEMAYMLNNTTDYKVEGGSLSGNRVTVGAGETVKITATVTLSRSDRLYIDSHFENGMFVEGYITLKNTDRSGVDLNVPYLAFYGNWYDAPIFDKTYYEVESEAHNGAIDEKDKIKADIYASTPLGRYYYDYLIPLGTYVYTMDNDLYTAIPAVEEHASVSYYQDCISGLFGAYAGLLRGAKQLDAVLTNAVTGEVVWSKTEYNCMKSHGTRPYYFEENVAGIDIGDNNTRYKVTLTAQLDKIERADDPDGKFDIRNSRDTFEYSFYIDYEPPTITDSVFRTEYDRSKKENRYYVDLTVSDNHYAMALRPVIVYTYDDNGTNRRTYSSLSEYPIPVYQDERGGEAVVTVEITDYMQRVKESDIPGGIVFVLEDYALNSSVNYVPFPETEADALVFTEQNVDIDIHEIVDLRNMVSHDGNEDTESDYDYLTNLVWESSDPSVAITDGGMVEGLKEGSAVISVVWTDANNTEHSASVTVNVSDTVIDNEKGGDKAFVSELKFTYYDTLFAFNGDIDRSEIGETGTMNYFADNYEISCYPSESVKLHYSLKPWNLDPARYELRYVTSNPRVATVNEKTGVVTAVAKGRATINLRIKVDDADDIMTARCSVNVKSEFVVENNELVAYKGNGGDVVVPDDKGILYIGPFAFCHYHLENEREVESDEDFDLKKDPLSNGTIKSVVLPPDVEEIRKYAFYSCTALEKVVLNAKCKKIFEYAFYGDENLRNINLDNVLAVSIGAFAGCTRLQLIDTSNIISMGANAFSGTSVISVDLSNLHWTGEATFSYMFSADGETQMQGPCLSLKEIKVSPATRLSAGMFEGCVTLEEIKGSFGSVQIPDYAFNNCQRLKAVTFTGELTYVGEYAFARCTRLNSVIFDKGCEYIADAAFAGTTALTNVILPRGDVRLGNFVFASVSSLTGSTVEYSGLKKLIFSPTTRLTDMGVGVFDGARDFAGFEVNGSQYYSADGRGSLLTKDGKTLLLATPELVGSYQLPSTVETIGAGAFCQANITSFTTASGSNLKTIESGAFAYCDELTSVTLPATCTTVGDYAFRECEKLSTFTAPGVTSFGAESMVGTAVTTLTLASGATTSEAAFGYCEKLKTLTVGENVTLGVGAFMYCTALETVNMPNTASVTLGEAAFYECSSLETIDATKVDGMISSLCFYNCVSLAEIDLGSLKSVGAYAFAGCEKLATITMPEVKYIGAAAFTYTEGDTSGTGHDAVAVTVLDMPKVEMIGELAFNGLPNLITVNMPKVTSIGEGMVISNQNAYVFYGTFGDCDKLATVNMGDLARLPDCAFYNCTSLTNIDLSKVKEIGIMALAGVPIEEAILPECETLSMYAFQYRDVDNDTLVSLSAPKLKTLGQGALSGAVALKEVDLPSLEVIESDAFAGCVSLVSLTLPASLREVGMNAFLYTDSFESFKYKESDGSLVSDKETDNFVIDEGVLYLRMPSGRLMLSVYPQAKDAEEYEVIDGTRRIDFGAAMFNTSLQKVILPDSLTNIGNMAFYGCDNLKEVWFKSYYAPQLEGGMMEEVDLTSNNKDEYPRWQSLYKYSYYLRVVGELYPWEAMYYQNFIATVTSEKASGLVYVYPENSHGYDSYLYKAYFDAKLDGDDRVTSGKAPGAFAVNFLAACEELPAGTATRFDSVAIGNARTAYNALLNNPDERQYVSQSVIDNFLALEAQCNADAVVYLITRIYDVDSSKFVYEKIQSVWREYGFLTEEEKALVSNYDVLEGKIAELRAVMPGEFDLNKSYSSYVFPEYKEDEGCGCGGCGSATVGLSTFGGAFVLCLLAVAITFVGRKKRGNR